MLIGFLNFVELFAIGKVCASKGDDLLNKRLIGITLERKWEIWKFNYIVIDVVD